MNPKPYSKAGLKSLSFIKLKGGAMQRTFFVRDHFNQLFCA
jgi:hypothetical protein